MPAGTVAAAGLADADCHAWNPGVLPDIPARYRALESIFRPEATASTFDETREHARFTGLPQEQLVAFRAERLALHELILRVTTHVAVAEGAEEEAFGRHFRATALRIWQQHVCPELPRLARLHQELREQAGRLARERLERAFLREDPAAPPVSGLRRWFARRPPPPPPESAAERQHRVIAALEAAVRQEADPLGQAVARSLHRVVASATHASGQLPVDLDLLARLATIQVANRFGAQRIGELLDPLVDRAIREAGLQRIEVQARPTLISLKGASASGKSSVRPMLKQLMLDHGISNETSVTISPDIWRRLLLDYEALGEAHKYAGYLTSREVALIDAKLDRYIRKVADEAAGIPHMVVDRFRFDSFSSSMVARALDATYARYVDTMYMYFLVVPPAVTVERGWTRALQRGRYKAVEDFLAHSVEAYRGMPRLLFKWLSFERPRYRYWFLDNMVPKGTFPAVCAFGDHAGMTILRPAVLVDIERYQKINIYAQCAEQTGPSAEVAATHANLGFLRECLRRMVRIDFCRAEGDPPYLRWAAGRLEVLDDGALQAAMQDAATAEILQLLWPSLRPA